jgi:hypothetical protein
MSFSNQGSDAFAGNLGDALATHEPASQVSTHPTPVSQHEAGVGSATDENTPPNDNNNNNNNNNLGSTPIVSSPAPSSPNAKSAASGIDELDSDTDPESFSERTAGSPKSDVTSLHFESDAVPDPAASRTHLDNAEPGVPVSTNDHQDMATSEQLETGEGTLEQESQEQQNAPRHEVEHTLEVDEAELQDATFPYRLFERFHQAAAAISDHASAEQQTVELRTALSHLTTLQKANFIEEYLMPYTDAGDEAESTWLLSASLLRQLLHEWIFDAERVDGDVQEKELIGMLLFVTPKLSSAQEHLKIATAMIEWVLPSANQESHYGHEPPMLLDPLSRSNARFILLKSCQRTTELTSFEIILSRILTASELEFIQTPSELTKSLPAGYDGADHPLPEDACDDDDDDPSVLKMAEVLEMVQCVNEALFCDPFMDIFHGAIVQAVKYFEERADDECNNEDSETLRVSTNIVTAIMLKLVCYAGVECFVLVSRVDLFTSYDALLQLSPPACHDLLTVLGADDASFELLIELLVTAHKDVRHGLLRALKTAVTAVYGGVEQCPELLRRLVAAVTGYLKPTTNNNYLNTEHVFTLVNHCVEVNRGLLKATHSTFTKAQTCFPEISNRLQEINDGLNNNKCTHIPLGVAAASGGSSGEATYCGECYEKAKDLSAEKASLTTLKEAISLFFDSTTTPKSVSFALRPVVKLIPNCESDEYVAENEGLVRESQLVHSAIVIQKVRVI